jgi:hypothetical protein
MLGSLPFLSHTLPLVTGILPQSGEALLGALPGFAADYLHVLETSADAFAQLRQALSEKLASLVAWLRSGEEAYPYSEQGSEDQCSRPGSAAAASITGPGVVTVLHPALL